MAFAQVDSGTVGSATSATSVTVTPTSTLPADRLLIVGVTSNAVGSITSNADAGGGWTTLCDFRPGDVDTCQVALFYKITNGSEPSSYDFDFANSSHRAVFKAFSYAGGAPTIDAACNFSRNPASGRIDLECDAIDGEIISDGALSIIFGTKDTRSSSGQVYDTADNSYVGVVGAVAGQVAAMAHRIFTTGETFSGNVHLDVTDLNDDLGDHVSSAHVSFVEAAGDTTAPVLTSPTATPSGTSVDIEVTSDDTEGELRGRIYAQGDAPTGTEVFTGTSDETIVASATAITSPVAGVNSFATITGLSPGNYVAKFSQDDTAGNISNDATEAIGTNFTIAAPASVKIDEATGRGIGRGILRGIG